MSRINLRDAMTVDIPEGELDGLRIEKITVQSGDFANFRAAMHARSTREGTYTTLRLNGRLWMSDTDAERNDHLPPLWQIEKPSARHVLINGLGLGMVLKAALVFPHVEHVDVVEIDKRVVELVGAHYDDPRVTIHHADAYEQAKAWPCRTRWDVAWHDIWPDLCTDNLPDMARLHRSYGRRVRWQGSWGHGQLLARRRHETRMGW